MWGLRRYLHGYWALRMGVEQARWWLAVFFAKYERAKVKI